MDEIQIEGHGTLEVPGDFRQWDPAKQQDYIKRAVEYKTKQPTTTEKVVDKGVDFVKDTAGDVVETAGDIVIDTTAALPDALGNLLDGRLDKIVFQLGGIILGNVGELIITVGANGLYTLTTASGTVLIDSLKSVDLTKIFNALKNSAVVASLKNANVDNFKEKLKFATGVDTKNVEKEYDSLTDKARRTWSKIASAPGEAALGVGNELTFGGLVAGLELAGYDIDKDSEAYKAGENVGLIASLAGGPALAAKFLGNAAKSIVRKAFRGHAKRTNIGKIQADEVALKDLLKDVGSRKLYGEAGEKVYKAIKHNINKDLKDIDSMLKTLRSKRTEYGDSVQDIRSWWNEAVGEKASNSILKKYPDIFESVFDRLLKQSQKGRASSGYVDDLLKNPLVDNLNILMNNWPSGLVEAVGLVGGDLAANYALAYRNAVKNGAPDSEARDIAFAFMIEKTPKDIGFDILSKLTKGTILSLAPKAGRLYVAGSRTEDGQIIDPRTNQQVGIEAGRGGRDISPKGTGGDYGIPKQFNTGGRVPYIKRKGIMRY